MIPAITSQHVRPAKRELYSLHRLMAIDKEPRTCRTCDWCRDQRCHNPATRFRLRPDDDCMLWAKVELASSENTELPSRMTALFRD